MNLPNYFLADVPPEATLTPTMITEACQTLKRNRAQYLAQRSTQSLVNVLSHLASEWLKAEFPFRKLALEAGPAALRFSRPTLANGLDAFFKHLTPENFQALLEQDLGHTRRLDEIIASNAEHKTNRASIALGPDFLVQITSGTLPVPALSGMVLGLLARSAQFIKCASGTGLVPRLFAHSVYEAEPKLASCLEIAEWRGTNAELEQALFEQADCATAAGTDETLETIRRKLLPRTRFVAYANRVSFAYVSSDVLSGLNTRKVIARAGADITAWNQLGSLSPHVLYVQHGGSIQPEQFAESLAEELARREETEPRGDLPEEIGRVIVTRRKMYQMRAAYARSAEAPADWPKTDLWCSSNSTAWTVVYETDQQFQTSCLNRFIYVKSVSSLEEALSRAASVRGKVSTVGLAAPEDEGQELALQLALWGVPRVCPLGQMQNPPLAWRHDGKTALGELVTWTDWEF